MRADNSECRMLEENADRIFISRSLGQFCSDSRGRPSLTNVDDKNIYHIGGHRDSDHFPFMERWNIEAEKWTMWDRFPELNTGRSEHSTCHLGGYLYVVGGVSWARERLGSIEKLDLNQDLENYKTRTEWQLIKLATIPARSFPVFCVLNST